MGFEPYRHARMVENYQPIVLLSALATAAKITRLLRSSLRRWRRKNSKSTSCFSKRYDTTVALLAKRFWLAHEVGRGISRRGVRFDHYVYQGSGIAESSIVHLSCFRTISSSPYVPSTWRIARPVLQDVLAAQKDLIQGQRVVQYARLTRQSGGTSVSISGIVSTVTVAPPALLMFDRCYATPSASLRAYPPNTAQRSHTCSQDAMLMLPGHSICLDLQRGQTLWTLHMDGRALYARRATVCFQSFRCAFLNAQARVQGSEERSNGYRRATSCCHAYFHFRFFGLESRWL